VSSDGCRTCPVQAVNCTHLRFSLRQSSPRPLIVRYNGRTEVWDDEPAEVHFEQAACAAQVMPIEHPQVCADCALRLPTHAVAEQPLRRRKRRAIGGGKVVPFPGHQAMAPTG